MEKMKDLRLAVLIDAENIPASSVQGLLEEVAKYGTPTFKRIYADWTKPHVVAWKNLLLEHAITPIQQYSYTSGKNATDSAMIIDAMDILYTGRVDGFCIVSSDSDFTRLATRLREAGMRVFGLGERKTPLAFISACDKFIYLEILKRQKEQVENERPAEKPARRTTRPQKEAAPPPAEEETPIRPIDRQLVRLISESINDLADDDGWVALGDLGNMLLKKQPDFDTRNYGFKKLVPLIRSIDRFETDEQPSGKGNARHVFVRLRARR